MRPPDTLDSVPRSEIPVLILSADSIAAALLGALVETLGYDVRFARPPEPADAAIRRTRPRICLVDCNDPDACRQELLGRAAIRGICVVIFGTPAVLERMRDLVEKYGLGVLLMPPDIADLERVLARVSQDDAEADANRGEGAHGEGLGPPRREAEGG
jgi:DNA-binding NtrC family response regulator